MGLREERPFQDQLKLSKGEDADIINDSLLDYMPRAMSVSSAMKVLLPDQL